MTHAPLIVKILVSGAPLYFAALYFPLVARHFDRAAKRGDGE